MEHESRAEQRAGEHCQHGSGASHRTWVGPTGQGRVRARPVSVSVSTVVVRSSTPRLRTVELRSPIAIAVSATTGQR